MVRKPEKGRSLVQGHIDNDWQNKNSGHVLESAAKTHALDIVVVLEIVSSGCLC